VHRMSWIDDRTTDLLRVWLQKTAAPMLASELDGGIIWCNPALEEFLGYTIVEFTRANNPITWDAITVDRGDLVTDMALSADVAAGNRFDYQLTKQYRAKDGAAKNVVIHVLRYPLIGDLECLLVSIYPIDHGSEFALKELKEMRREHMMILERLDTPGDVMRLLDWAEKHPKKSAIATVFLSFLLFGDRVLEVLTALSNVTLLGK
jgi:hypothetical protein